MFLARRFCQFVAGQPSSCVLFALCGVLLAFCPRSGPRSDRKVTISPETTYLVEPLRPDGYVDYRAALNATLSQGVTPESNAVVVLWQAIGPGSLPQDAVQYAKLLGVAPPPPSGSYYRPVSAFRIKPPPVTLPPTGIDPNDPDQQLEEAADRPWSKQEFPAVAAWLQANSNPLRLVREASGRPRYFNPLVGPDGTGLVTGQINLILDERDLVYLLAADATLKIGADKLDEAWQDALTCHRLARLRAQGPMLTDNLFATSIDGIGINIDCLIAGSDKLTPQQARRFAREFAELPPLGSTAETIRLGGRFWTLDAIVDLATSTTSLSWRGIFVNSAQSALPRWTPNLHLDWDATFRLANSWIDRMAQVAAIPSPIERRKAAATLTADLQQIVAETKRAPLNPLGYSELVASNLAEKSFAIWTLGAELSVINGEDRHLDLQEMCRVAFALAAYRIDHGKYPVALSELTPRYINAVPKDRFTGWDFHYKLETNGYVLYGSNSDGSDPPLTDPTGDPLQERVGIRVPPKTNN